MKIIALLLLVAFAFTAAAKEPPHYRFHRLAPFSGRGHSHPAQINSAGTVIGTAETNGVLHAVLWSNGTLIDLGLLPRGGARLRHGDQ